MTTLPSKNQLSAYLEAEGFTAVMNSPDDHRFVDALRTILHKSDPSLYDDERLAHFWKEKISHGVLTSWPAALKPSEMKTPTLQSVPVLDQFDMNAVIGASFEPIDFWTAIWALLLARYVGESVVTFGAPQLYTLPRPDGLLLNLATTLPLSVSYDAKQSFREWMSVVRHARAELHSAGPVAWESLVEWSALSPATSLVESLVIGETSPDTVALPKASVPVTLRLGAHSAPQVEWDSARFDDVAAHRLAGHLAIIAKTVLKNPDQPCGQIALLTPGERQQIVINWNSVRAPYSSNHAIHELIEDHARQTPNAIAVSCEGQTLTYGELNERADAIARRLVAHGVKPDMLVPICVSRSVDMIVGLLAVLKAGGAYVPLDPNYPVDRLAFVLEEVASPFLVTEKALVGKLPAGNATVELVDAELGAVSSQALPKVAGENLAYVIYTSGSTGKPKGVLISHRNLASSTASRVAYYGPCHTNFLLLSSYAFDSSVAGIFWMLTTGGTLTLVPEEAQQDLTRIDHLVTRENITTMLCLPSLYLLLLERWLDAVPSALRCVIVAGEACPPKLVAQHRQQLPQTVLYNEYGPTEGTVWSNVHRCDKSLGTMSVPIGRAIPNAHVYLLDSNFQPVPIGVAGEICIGGDGISRGYLGRPDLTASRFIANPFIPDERLYLTGDYGRFLPDGAVEFLGRRDQQVKVRGFRIELGEIESVLAQAPGIKECVVIVREDQPGDQRLVAYVTLPQDAPFSVSDLRHFVRMRLPEYMVPMAVMRLDDFARTATGKIDRKVLPVPDATSTASSAPFLAPGSALEQQLADIWKNELKLATVGVDDNFFDIGGHSLALVRVHQALQKALAREIPITELFQYPTIRSLAAQLGDKRNERSLAEKSQSRAQMQRAALARNRRPQPLTR